MYLKPSENKDSLVSKHSSFYYYFTMSGALAGLFINLLCCKSVHN